MLNRENGHSRGDENGKKVHTAAAENAGPSIRPWPPVMSSRPVSGLSRIVRYLEPLRAGLSESETGQLEALLTRLRDNVS